MTEGEASLPPHERSGRFPAALGLVMLVVLPLSAIGAADLFTWVLETLPVMIGLPLLAATWRSHPLSRLLYGLIFVHGLILIVGGHYTYAQVPLGEWARGWFGWDRNNYDKLGHFAQGFVPALLTREVLLRWSPFAAAPRSRLLPILCVSVPLAFSALYEIIEWLVAVASGEGADAFLGTQGYAWDTQSDMGFALVGAVVALLLMPRAHDRSIGRLTR